MPVVSLKPGQPLYPCSRITISPFFSTCLNFRKYGFAQVVYLNLCWLSSCLWTRRDSVPTQRSRIQLFYVSYMRDSAHYTPHQNTLARRLFGFHISVSNRRRPDLPNTALSIVIGVTITRFLGIRRRRGATNDVPLKRINDRT